MLYIIIAILLFGALIAVHEFGHFITAKAFGVRVNEFAIGMGPALFSKQKGETLYALRAFPIGGYCAMEGEEDDSDDPRSFGKQAMWKKLIVLAAGAAMNFLTGLVLVLVLFSQAQAFAVPVLVGFMDGFPLEGEQGLMVGDRILSVNGERIRLSSDVSLFLDRGYGEPYDMVVERNGAKVVLDDLPLELQEYTENGKTTRRYGLYFGVEEATVANKLKNSWYTAMNFVRLVRISLTDLITGAAGVKDLTGPVGIVDTITQVGNRAETLAGAARNILHFCALIAVNLAVMNLLPLPALDGGRIFFLLINGLWFLLFRRRIDPKYESYVHIVGLLALLALMVVVTFNDLIRVFGG